MLEEKILHDRNSQGGHHELDEKSPFGCVLSHGSYRLLIFTMMVEHENGLRIR